MNNIRAASVQFQHVPGDKPANLNKICAFVERAEPSGVDLIVFPEMCINGYWHVRKLRSRQLLRKRQKRWAF